MSAEAQDQEQPILKKKEEKKPQIIVKLEWIFGIRKDFLPNVEFLGKDTIVYPASNNIVIFNYLRNMGNMNLQHYIPGQAHSKGITCMIAMNYSKKVVGFSEDLEDGVKISFYAITIKQGLKNFPVPQTIYDFRDEEEFPRIKHTYCMAYSKSRRTNDYYIVALASDEKDYYFILWKWDLEAVRDKPIVQKIELHEPKIEEEKEPSKDMGSSESASIKEEESGVGPSNNESKDENNYKDEPIEINYNNTFFKIGFQTLDNTLFSLQCKYSVVFYRISSEGITEEYRINLVDEHGHNDYGNEIFGSNWLNDGPFCLITDHYINIFNIKEEKLLQKLINPGGDLKIITPFTLTNSYEGFIAGGKNKKFQIYAKKNIDEDNSSEKDDMEKNGEKNYNNIFYGNFKDDVKDGKGITFYKKNNKRSKELWKNGVIISCKVEKNKNNSNNNDDLNKDNADLFEFSPKLESKNRNNSLNLIKYYKASIPNNFFDIMNLVIMTYTLLYDNGDINEWKENTIIKLFEKIKEY